MRLRALSAALLALVPTACTGPQTTSWHRSAEACPGADPAAAWATSTPAEAGLDASALDALARRIEAGELGNLHSLLVVREGRLVYERYFAGEDRAWSRSLGTVEFAEDVLHDLRSVTKSVVSALIGIAQGHGWIGDLDQPLVDAVGRGGRDVDGGLHAVTLRHALTMSAGLEWRELELPYWDPRNGETRMWLGSDPLGWALGRPVESPPGAVFEYNGALPTALAAAVERGAGVSIDRFAVEHLMCPLGIPRFEWLRHRSGLHISASGLRLRPRDMARFGWMMLDGGRFAGRQVVPASFVRDALRAQIDTGDPGRAGGYGYLWWIRRLPAALGGFDVPVARGNGGQRIALIETARMVVVVTAGEYDAPTQNVGPREAIDSVIAALRDDGD